MTQEPKCERCRWAKINWRVGEQYEHVNCYYAGEPVTAMLTRDHTSVQCRRYPPTKAQTENDSDGWPWIAGDDFCGEFQPKDQHHD